ncbi:DUF2867 domain-containing protein [Streptomyces purpureus]|uniref:DUF2867 domain-containing protein n=1 Tax=Streptomyces purpureus TaxID=1951 RepID=A0A918LX22_9ACTN|nr:DUF2867 domain-containing protein [Streptomyces purpureus]GGT62369.1 hypothetical protein GCM10014713_64720 [Streptomyces purpureus]
MKLPNSAHTRRPWRIHEVADGFQVEDVWALPTPGGPDDFPRLVSTMVSDSDSSFPDGANVVVRFLWRVREKLGALLGWDNKNAGVGSRVISLRDNLPSDLQEAPRGPDFTDVPLTSIYLLPDEWASEMANRTVHSVMHVAWVQDESGAYRGQMTVLIKPNGLLGAAYMAAIKPFRSLIVLPALMRTIKRDWSAHAEAR